ncbi:DNA polymerase domain-containing protein [Vulcanisaeta souniana]|uniref:DNA polymerase domain-containing protein n=1 Tax=Vulcanisaeta souniana TaxID=164452 RepID=UPI00166B16FA|nr:DNA polymerase domain-containing protein [Vulcanisaeta souniana]
MAIDVEVRGGKPIYGYTLGDDVNITSDVRDIAGVDFDIAVTYNGWSFDVKYLPMYRNSRYALYTDDGVKPLMDLYVFVESGFKSSLGIQEEASKLYDVAIQLGIHRSLGIGEAELLRLKSLQSRVDQLTTSELTTYLGLDVLITHQLAMRWLPVLQALGAITGSNPMVINQVAESASPGHLAEALIHKYLQFNGIILQDRRREMDYEAGDKTRARSYGLFRNVGEYDFSAMYPSLYTQDNVDPINIRECQSGFPVRTTKGTKRVCFEPGGLVHKVLSSLYRARKVTKALKATYGDAPDQAVKILVNSAYGVFGKSGIGMVNEWVAAYIAQKTQAIFDDLWQRYQPIYGDTDSMYIQLDGRDADKLLMEINDYLHRAYGPLMEMKLEEVWDVVYIPRSKAGGAAEKTYIKMRGDELVIKGGALKPRDLPRGLRYGAYRDWVRALLLGDARLDDLISKFISGASLEDLFIEYSISFRDLLYTHEGSQIRTIDRSRFPALAYLAVASGREALIDLRARTINAKPIDLDAFVDVLYLPIETQGETKAFAFLINNEPVIARVSIQFDQKQGKILTKVANLVRASREDIEKLSIKAIRESGLFSHIA